MADQLDQSSNQHPISFPSQIKVTFSFSQAAGQLQEQCSLKKNFKSSVKIHWYPMTFTKLTN
jgi:hypothetical protein